MRDIVEDNAELQMYMAETLNTLLGLTTEKDLRLDCRDEAKLSDFREQCEEAGIPWRREKMAHQMRIYEFITLKGIDRDKEEHSAHLFVALVLMNAGKPSPLVTKNFREAVTA